MGAMFSQSVRHPRYGLGALGFCILITCLAIQWSIMLESILLQRVPRIGLDSLVLPGQNLECPVTVPWDVLACLGVAEGPNVLRQEQTWREYELRLMKLVGCVQTQCDCASHASRCDVCSVFACGIYSLHWVA